MTNIVAEQIADYPRVHRARANLKIHILAVPMFWAGAIALIVAATTMTVNAAIFAGALLVVSIALQGWGHGREAERPVPFKNPFEFVVRITTENLYVFPRFVLSGGWAKAWAAAT